MGFVWGFIVSVFWAIVISLVLWICCVLCGRLVNTSFKAALHHHLACFLTAVLTCILLAFVFNLNKVSKMLDQIQLTTVQATGYANFSTADYIDQLKEQYPLLASYIDAETIKDHANLPQEGLVGAKALEAAVQQFTSAVEAEVSAIRRPLVWAVVVLQLLCFGFVIRSAYTMQTTTSFANDYENDY